MSDFHFLAYVILILIILLCIRVVHFLFEHFYFMSVKQSDKRWCILYWGVLGFFWYYNAVSIIKWVSFFYFRWWKGWLMFKLTLSPKSQKYGINFFSFLHWWLWLLCIGLGIFEAILFIYSSRYLLFILKLSWGRAQLISVSWLFTSYWPTKILLENSVAQSLPSSVGRNRNMHLQVSVRFVDQ